MSRRDGRTSWVSLVSNGVGRADLMVDGKPVVSVGAITWNGGPNEVSTVEVELRAIPIEVHQHADIIWTGLESVPTEALRDELMRRALESKGDND